MLNNRQNIEHNKLFKTFLEPPGTFYVQGKNTKFF